MDHRLEPERGALNRDGTGYVMLRLVRPDSTDGTYVFVTAKHVFEDIAGDTATLVLRRRSANGDTIPYLQPLPIRKNKVPLYTAHPTADVAVIDVAIPSDSTLAEIGSNITNVNWLATDDFLKSIGIHPGDELMCLGYPYGNPTNDAYYPLLRSGKIASYPILPSKKAEKILYDFHVDDGDSGGPVYFSYTSRPFNQGLALGKTYQKIFGLVTQKLTVVGAADPYIGVIVPSVYIKETIDLLAGFESKPTP